MMRYCLTLRHRPAAGYVALVLCGFALGFGFLSGNAAAQDESPKYFYYSTVENLDNPNAGPNIHALTMSTEKIGVMFEEGLTDTQQGELLAKYSEVESAAKEGQWRMLRNRRPILVVPLRDVKASNQVEDLLSSLKNEGGVADAAPVFQIVPGCDELLTDEFFASFPANTPKEEIEKLNSQYGVEVVYTRDWSLIGKVGYGLRVTEKSGLNALEMANLYYEHPLTLRATPCFLGLYSVVQSTPNDTYFANQWYLDQIDAPDAWDVECGSSEVTIAIIDTGVDLDHEDLTDKFLRDVSNNIIGRNFTTDPPDGNFDDDNGHGTMVSGVASAETNNGTGVAGVSWHAALMPVKGIPASGNLDPEDLGILGQAIEWAAYNGADVISMSFGFADNDAVHGACEMATALGCVLVASSSNYELGGAAFFPGGYREVVCVGASDQNDMRWHHAGIVGSNWGYHVDVTGASESTGIYTTAMGGGYTSTFNATSAACPQVSGLASLVLSVDPNLSPAQVQAILQFSADDLAYTRLIPYEIAGAGRDVSTGYGRINCAEALSLAAAPRLTLRDSEGAHLASFDSEGHFVLEGNGFSMDSVEWDALTSTKLAEELQPSQNCTEFIVRDGAGTVLARLTGDEDPLWDDDGIGGRDDDNDGLFDEMMFIKGHLYENVSVDLDTAVTVPSFRVRNSAGQTVALINGTTFTNTSIEPSGDVLAGSLLLKGRAFIGVNPDRWDSIGR